MFICERCGSRFSAMHAATMENCPRCMVRDRTAAPLTFKAFRLPPSIEAKQSRAARHAPHRSEAGQPISA